MCARDWSRATSYPTHGESSSIEVLIEPKREAVRRSGAHAATASGRQLHIGAVCGGSIANLSAPPDTVDQCQSRPAIHSRDVSTGEVILLAVRWYLRYPLAYEHVAEMLAERGLAVDTSCVWRWVQAYAPELNKRCRPHLRPTNKSYRIDETYIRIKGQDRYLYRAVDSTGRTIEFLLTKRDAAAAKRFLVKAIEASGNAMPRVMNVDKNPAYPAAVEALKAEGALPRRGLCCWNPSRAKIAVIDSIISGSPHNRTCVFSGLGRKHQACSSKSPFQRS